MCVCGSGCQRCNMSSLFQFRDTVHHPHGVAHPTAPASSLFSPVYTASESAGWRTGVFKRATAPCTASAPASHSTNATMCRANACCCDGTTGSGETISPLLAPDLVADAGACCRKWWSTISCRSAATRSSGTQISVKRLRKAGDSSCARAASSEPQQHIAC